MPLAPPQGFYFDENADAAGKEAQLRVFATRRRQSPDRFLELLRGASALPFSFCCCMCNLKSLVEGWFLPCPKMSEGPAENVYHSDCRKADIKEYFGTFTRALLSLFETWF